MEYCSRLWSFFGHVFVLHSSTTQIPSWNARRVLYIAFFAARGNSWSVQLFWRSRCWVYISIRQFSISANVVSISYFWSSADDLVLSGSSQFQHRRAFKSWNTGGDMRLQSGEIHLCCTPPETKWEKKWSKKDCTDRRLWYFSCFRRPPHSSELYRPADHCNGKRCSPGAMWRSLENFCSDSI